MEERNVDGRGIELSQQGVNDCVAKGLSVIQGDADADLADYPNDAFDYVILSQTLQATRRPRAVLEHMLRIGRRAIVSVPNFGHWSVRAQLALRGRMPVTESLAHSWYDTPNIHFCTIADFVTLAHEVGATIDKSVALNRAGRAFATRLAEMGLEPVWRAGHLPAASRAMTPQGWRPAPARPMRRSHDASPRMGSFAGDFHTPVIALKTANDLPCYPSCYSSLSPHVRVFSQAAGQ